MKDRRDDDSEGRSTDAGSGDEAPRRPPSVRDALGPSRPRPAAPRPVRPLRTEGEADESPPVEDEKRPTPVRAAMGVSRQELRSVEFPKRSLRPAGDEGEAWIVREEGRAATGQPADASAPLLFLTFAAEDDPDTRVREVLAVGRSLEALSEAELEALLERARPFRPRAEPAEIFPGTRRSRGGRNR